MWLLLVVEFFLGSLLVAKPSVLLRSVYPLQRWNAALFTWAKVAQKCQPNAPAKTSGRPQWTTMAPPWFRWSTAKAWPPKRTHWEKCRNSIRLFCLNQKWLAFLRTWGSSFETRFFLNSLRPSPPSPPIGWKISLQQTDTYPPHFPRKGKSEIHLEKYLQPGDMLLRRRIQPPRLPN